MSTDLELVMRFTALLGGPQREHIIHAMDEAEAELRGMQTHATVHISKGWATLTIGNRTHRVRLSDSEVRLLHALALAKRPTKVFWTELASARGLSPSQAACLSAIRRLRGKFSAHDVYIVASDDEGWYRLGHKVTLAFDHPPLRVVRTSSR